ncbi:MAG: hypothetical protein RR057_01865, partial [Clostridia bacterium]
SSDLISVINKAPSTSHNADVITISIGGNNVLGPTFSILTGAVMKAGQEVIQKLPLYFSGQADAESIKKYRNFLKA